MILEHYNGYFWIQAEIAKLNYYPRTGHCFPDLVERNRGQVKAEIRSVIWNEQFKKINKRFKEIAKTELNEGMEVLLRGKLNFHSSYGFSIHIFAIDPQFTLGNMAKEKEDNINLLKKRGLFQLNKKLPFPEIPKNLAIISYNTSKGYADFNEVMHQEAKRFSINYQLFPAVLQGDHAAKTILEQLNYIQNNWIKKFDLVLIIRGGGGDVGMNAYNNYELCKAITQFPLPIITGIGHSTNQTIAEMVAHTNTITPTQTAYFIVEQFYSQEERLQQSINGLLQAYPKSIQSATIHLKNIQQSIDFQLRQKNENQNSMLRNVQLRIDKSTLYYLSKTKKNIENAQISILRNTEEVYEKENDQLTQVNKNLTFFLNNIYLKNEYALNLIANKVELSSPNNLLKKGYAIISRKNQVEKDVRNFKIDDLIHVKLHKGELEAQIKKITNYEQD